MKMFVLCPYCSRKLQAYTRVVLEHVVRQHMPGCFAAARARSEKAIAELAQLSLFNPTPARSE